MTVIPIADLRAAIDKAGAKWQPIQLPADFQPRALGWEPTPPEMLQQARVNADRMKLEIHPELFRAPMAAGLKAAVGGITTHPRKFDWRDQGVIGPVTDQGYCGSCVSFACTGLVGAQCAIENGGSSVHLSEADSHFNSSHGAHCSGWNNGDCLHQIHARGVVGIGDLTYDQAFDTPRQDDHTLPEGDAAHRSYLWQAHARAVANRGNRIYKVLDVTSWSGDDRKIYLSHIGPLVLGFTVYTDFDAYGGGVYQHTTGTSRGGHAVLVIGYDDDDQCWICRNSWGTGFGGAAHADGTGGGFFKMKYGTAGSDGEAFFGAQGVTVPAPAGWGGWWQVKGGTAQANSSVFGVSRSAEKLDIVAVNAATSTMTAAWEPGFTDGWHGWWQIQGGAAAHDSSIHLVTRSADHLDAFIVGTNHHIFTAAWQPGFSSWGGWWPVQGGIAAPGTSVFGVSRSADKLDIFCVGTDHGTYTAAWEPGFTDGWHGWWRIQGGVAAPNTSVTAVTRAPDHLDIFCVGTDHRVYTAAWEPGFTGWHGWWPVQGGVAAPNTSVFGVSRGLNKLDIFCVGTDRNVWTAAWQAGDTSWRGWWRIGHFRVREGTSVHAVSRTTDQIDIFAVGEDGGTYTASWHPGLTRWTGWSQVLGGLAAPQSMVTGVARDPHRLDIFTVGTDHKVYTAGWHDPSPVLTEVSATLKNKVQLEKVLVKP